MAKECKNCGMPMDDPQEKLCDFCKNDEYTDTPETNDEGIVSMDY
jgi:RNA polymerase subunit RPABC4/transcription elongation factor Spt4